MCCAYSTIIVMDDSINLDVGQNSMFCAKSKGIISSTNIKRICINLIFNFIIYFAY